MKIILSLMMIALTSHCFSNDYQNNIDTCKCAKEDVADFDTNNDTLDKKISIISARIVVYKDHNNHDKKQWKKLIRKITKSCDRMRSHELEKNSSITIQKEIQTIIHDLTALNDNSGISSEFIIEGSDGAPIKGCCGNNCQCAQRYKGNCPCSLDDSINRCLFPQEELPFDDKNENDEDDDTYNTIESTDEDNSNDFEEIDLDPIHK